MTTNAPHEVPVIIDDVEIPVPEIAIDMEDHAIAAFDFETLTKEMELFVNVRPMLSVAIDVIAGQE